MEPLPTLGDDHQGEQVGQADAAACGGARAVYIANAGDGTISVVDVASRRLVKTLRTPSALTGAYITAVTPGARVTDLVLR